MKHPPTTSGRCGCCGQPLPTLPRCRCGHLKGEHRIDLRVPRCDAWHPDGTACECQIYTPQEDQ